MDAPTVALLHHHASSIRRDVANKSERNNVRTHLDLDPILLERNCGSVDRPLEIRSMAGLATREGCMATAHADGGSSRCMKWMQPSLASYSWRRTYERDEAEIDRTIQQSSYLNALALSISIFPCFRSFERRTDDHNKRIEGNKLIMGYQFQVIIYSASPTMKNQVSLYGPKC